MVQEVVVTVVKSGGSLDLLPFRPDAISRWTHSTDLMLFLKSHLGGMISGKTRGIKREKKVDYSWPIENFDRGRRQFRALARQFAADAKRITPAQSADDNDQVEEIPNFLQDGNFGLISKYGIAWEAAVGDVLSDEEFFSPAHILETCDDLECSIELASKLYYKQALQVLRNSVETSILQIYFITDDSAFGKWIERDFKIPRIRGKGGLLNELTSKRVISEDFANKAADLYGRLNGSIHGEEDQLINRGIFTKEWHGRVFKYVRYLEWCDYFCRTVDFGLRALDVSVNLRRDILSKGGFRCRKCGNKSDFSIEVGQLMFSEYVVVRCNRCEKEMAFSKDAAVKLDVPLQRNEEPEDIAE